MKKIGKTLSDHVKDLKERKESLPFHKMDDVTRRKFIQGVGFFLAGVGVPSLFRFEKMSMLSKKIFGNSYAFAANPLTDRAVIKLYLRRGFSSAWMGIGHYNHDNVANNYLNVPWTNTYAKSFPVGNGNIVLNASGATFNGNSIQEDSDYLFANKKTGIQLAVFKATGNHTDTFNSCNRIGLMEMMTGRAATEADTTSAVLKAGLFFGDTSLVGVMKNPPTLASNIPIPLTHVIDASKMFTPPNFTTNQGKVLGSSLQEKILATINNKFTDDITNGVLQKGQDAIVSNADQAQIIMQNTFTNQLNPNYSVNLNKVSKLKTGLVDSALGNVRIINSMNMAEIFFVLMQCFELKITPFIGGLVINVDDWHQVVSPVNGSTDQITGFVKDRRYITGTYMAKAISNLVNNSNLWTNPYTGDPLEVMVVTTSEFSRSPLINGVPDNPNNNDGFKTDIFTVCSDISQNLFVPGSWGGVDSVSGGLMGYNVAGGGASHSTNIDLPDINTMYGYQTDLLQIDREKLGVSSTRYPGYPSLLK